MRNSVLVLVVFFIVGWICLMTIKEKKTSPQEKPILV
jgi:MFS-type transporter involved in bile tolerance (Atg22 family)